MPRRKICKLIIAFSLLATLITVSHADETEIISNKDGQIAQELIVTEVTIDSQKSESAENSLSKSSSNVDKRVGEGPLEDEIANEDKAKGIDPLSELPSVIFTLVVLVFGIFALAWLARRYSNFSMGGNKNLISVVSTLPVGSRERLTLVEVEGQKILVGITSQQITHIKSFDHSSFDQSNNSLNSEALEASNKDQIVDNSFAAKLKGLLNNKEGIEKS